MQGVFAHLKILGMLVFEMMDSCILILVQVSKADS